MTIRTTQLATALGKSANIRRQLGAGTGRAGENALGRALVSIEEQS